MATTLFTSLTEEDKSRAIERLIKDSTPRDDFFLMILLSILMASFGLLMNDVAIVIGSMLIAPILSPVMSLSLGVVIADSKLMLRSAYTIAKSVLVAIPAATAVTLLFASQVELGSGLNPEILTQTEPSIMFVAVAVVAGFAASFALIKPQLSDTLPGVAISVALIPPLAATGIGLAQLNADVISGALILFLVNAAAISFASIITFSFMNLYVKRNVAEVAVEKEDLAMEQEVEKAKRETKSRSNPTS